MKRNDLSAKDRIIGGIFCLSGLVCFGLSFTIFRADGRPYLFCFLFLLCALCIIFADNRKTRINFILGFITFLAIRCIWTLAIFGWP
jgi:hypothetical protein